MLLIYRIVLIFLSIYIYLSVYLPVCLSVDQCVRTGMAPCTVLAAGYRLAQGQHKLEVIRAVVEMINGILLETFESMSFDEYTQWAERSGWNFWSKIKTVEEARDDPNTKALGLISEGIGRVPFNEVRRALAPRL